MPATGALSGHAPVHQRQGRCAHRTHRGGTVGGEHFGHETQRVRELVDVRDHRQQRPLGEQAVADLAALGRTHAAGFAIGERRHVVVMHVALLVAVGVDGVEHLVHARHAERQNVEHLGLTTLEQAGAVRRVDETNLRRNRTEVGRGATVHAHTVVDDARAHCLLGQRTNRRLDLLAAAFELLGEGRLRGGDDGVEGFVALGLLDDGARLGDVV